MKTLVFGGTGMLGNDLMKLSTSENELISVGIEDCRIEILSEVKATIARTKPDRVMLLAAFTDVDGAESKAELCRAVNVEGPRAVGQACQEAGIPVLMISTDYVFAKLGPVPHGEDDAHDPLNVYGQSKSDGEQALRDSGALWTIVRCSWLFGIFGKSFPRTMLELAKTRDTLAVVDDQIGAPTFTGHLAVGLMKIMKQNIRGNLHLCAGGQVSWCGLAQELFSQTGKKITVNPVPTSEFPRPATRPLWSVLSQKNCEEAGIVLPPWQEGVKDWLLEYHQSEEA
jgi:dTDP-4-dehydrorhamnose reductase